MDIDRCSQYEKEKTLTILMAINKKVEDSDKAIKLLNDQKEKISFLNPKIVLIDTIKNFQDYSLFCIKELGKCFDSDFVLIVQNDGRILNPAAFSYDFFNYDYIGAPWSLNPLPNWFKNKIRKIKRDASIPDLHIGNGGFSLRSKGICEYLQNHSENYVIKDGKIENEDTYICIKRRCELEAAGFKFAPYDIAKSFSVEKSIYSGEFGGHKWIKKDGKRIDVKTL